MAATFSWLDSGCCSRLESARLTLKVGMFEQLDVFPIVLFCQIYSIKTVVKFPFNSKKDLLHLMQLTLMLQPNLTVLVYA